MLRALLLFALVLGVVLGGLMLLRNTAGPRPPKVPREPRPPRIENKDDDEGGW